jgi:hypothetical protein
MVKRVRYVNKTTRETSPTLEQWIESLVDPDKQAMLDIYNAEIQRESGAPASVYATMFERYMAECNIEIIVTVE